MKKTFECNESIIITIPIASLEDAGVDQLMPQKFMCTFRDSYKIFVLGGKPKPVGAAQAIAGVFLCLLVGILFHFDWYFPLPFIIPNVVFLINGVLTYAAGKGPRMVVAKLSFSLNILGLFWSVTAFVIHLILLPFHSYQDVEVSTGVNSLVMGLLVVEHCLCVFSIYWLSKAICRQHFNTLPIIVLKQGN